MRFCVSLVLSMVVVVLSWGIGVALGGSVALVIIDENTEYPRSEVVRATREKLARKGKVDGQEWSVDLVLADTTMSKALTYLSDVAAKKPRNIKFIVDLRRIEDAGIDLGETLMLSAKGISLARALGLVLGDELSYRVEEDGTVLISAREVLNERLPTRAYNIREVLMAMRALRVDSDTKAGGQIGCGPIRPGSGIFDDDDDDEQDLRAERLQGIIEGMVRDTEPWESMGGRACMEFAPNGLMIVSATEDMHGKIFDLCRNILLVDKSRGQKQKQRIDKAKATVKELYGQRDELKKKLRALQFEAGREEINRSRVFAEAEQLRRESQRASMELAVKKAEMAAYQAQITAAAKRQEEEGFERRRRPNLTSKVNSLAIQIVGLKARVRVLNAAGEQPKVERLLELADQMERLEDKQEILERRIDDQQRLADHLRRRLEGIPPLPHRAPKAEDDEKDDEDESPE